MKLVGVLAFGAALMLGNGHGYGLPWQTSPGLGFVTPPAPQTPTGLSFSPTGPVQVQDTAASGTPLASVVVNTSDQQAFTGSVAITSQTAVGMAALSSPSLPSTVQVNSISPADDGNQFVTAQACAATTCKSATLGIIVTAPITNIGDCNNTILSADRAACVNWKNAGLLSIGGIPNRTVQCGATINPRGGGQDDTANIQNAINACPVGQVVQLAAGTFTINEGSTVHISTAVTLRGAGAAATILQRTNGAQLGTYIPGSSPSAMILVTGNTVTGSSQALTVDAAQGTTSIQVANGAEFSVGEIVLLDEASGAGWQPERNAAWAASCPQIWASSDYRVEWMRHNPSCNGDDGSDIFGYFQIHNDHPTNEMHQISAISGNTITFDDPVMISYRTSHSAQLTPMLSGPLNAGVEGLAVKGGDDSNIHIQNAAYAWVKDVENSYYLNDGFRLEGAYRVQLESDYIHHAVWPVPGGAGYNISLAYGSSEVLIENSISMLANKVMVMRASGAGSVVAYNYMDDGFISGSDGWAEIGLNASHLVGPHHVLFEGNQSWNGDSDSTHGNSIYMSFFRNWMTGFRAKFTDYLNNTVIDDGAACCGPMRAGSAHQYSYWFSFIGNVLGTSGKIGGWIFEDDGGANRFPANAIWTLGYFDVSPQGTDPQVAVTTVRDGNYDYVHNSIAWDSSDSTHTLPYSLYLSTTPSFFMSGSGYTWPWVTPTSTPQILTGPTTSACATNVGGPCGGLPAKARIDNGTPFTQP